MSNDQRNSCCAQPSTAASRSWVEEGERQIAEDVALDRHRISHQLTLLALLYRIAEVWQSAISLTLGVMIKRQSINQPALFNQLKIDAIWMYLFLATRLFIRVMIRIGWRSVIDQINKRRIIISGSIQPYDPCLRSPNLSSGRF
jgi:hypothetical protein